MEGKQKKVLINMTDREMYSTQHFFTDNTNIKPCQGPVTISS